MSVTKSGRPAAGEEREPLTIINFKADAETFQALQALERTLPNVRGRRSILLRKLIREAFSKIKK